MRWFLTWTIRYSNSSYQELIILMTTRVELMTLIDFADYGG